MGHAQQANTSKADIGKDFEIASPPYLIENDEIGANKEDDFGGLLKISFPRSILRNPARELEVSRGLHGLHQGPNVGVKVLGNGLGEGGLS